MPKADRPKRTEEQMLAALRKRHQDGGANGPAWAFIEQVRDAAGFNAKRTLDAIAFSLWPSRGLEAHGFEVKCNRSDWLKEMRQPDKSEGFMQWLDRFYLVASHADIVQEGELPPTWGLIVAQGNDKITRLVTQVQAPKLERQPPPPTFIAALVRQAAVMEARGDVELIAVEREGYKRGVEAGQQDRQWEFDRLTRRLEQLEQREKEFVDVLGADLKTATRMMQTHVRRNPGDLGRAVKDALDGQNGLNIIRNQIAHAGRDIKRLADTTERILGEHGIELE